MSDSQLRRAAALIKQNRAAEARRIARALLDEDPGNAAAWAILSQAARNPAEALAHLRRAQALARDAQVRAWAEREIARLEGSRRSGRRNLALAGAALAGAVILLLGGSLVVGNSPRTAALPETTEPAPPTHGIHPVAMTLTAWALTPSPTATSTPTPAPTSTPRPTITWAPTRTPRPAVTRAAPAAIAPPPTGIPASIPQATREPTLPRPQAEMSGFALGGQVPNSFANADRMHASGMTWVKLQITWPGVPASTAGQFVQSGHALGFKVLLSITGPRYPESIDFAAYPAYLREVAAYGPDAIEVWNEMNLNTEWPAGQIDPASYVRNMLAPAYRAIKQANPQTAVITGALASTGVHDGVSVWNDEAYLRGMMRAGAARYADCLGFHYNAGATSPHAASGHPADPGEGHYSWYFGPTIDVYRRGAGGALPLCLTEIGYLSGEGYPPLPEDWFWAGGTSAQTQADWLAEAVQMARETGIIRLVIVWNVDFTTWSEDGDPQAGFAIVRPDGSCPACETLRVVMQ